MHASRKQASLPIPPHTSTPYSLSLSVFRLLLTKLFHPNVASSTGEICVNTLKKDWKSDLGIKHVLLTIKCLLIVPNPESALNEEAGKLLLERYDDYCARAKLYTEIHASEYPPRDHPRDLAKGLQHIRQKKTLSKKRKSLKEEKRPSKDSEQRLSLKWNGIL
ncbi:Ubiquitin-conjugating enzyme E2 S [Caligus rogercresseyi]|uniref:Ubiquitin-conjugating enzyme E2 S n=1 Tax=Caligus rogercresseyi TaxID=217165 RepID=A0A7T8GV84_CALRO|nr:Ubiquitin-conjugating enzyme E2 S [Caligus rogercresseyi]